MIFGLAAPALPDIATYGLNPYDPITGDKVVALIAQINRFAGKKVDASVLDVGCPARTYLPAPLPVTNALDPWAASMAGNILRSSMVCTGNAQLTDYGAVKRLDDGMYSPVKWVMADLESIIVRIATFGDTLGLEPASVGITKRNPNIKPPPAFPTGMVLFGLLIISAAVVTWRMR
jgi:hypothetical protein